MNEKLLVALSELFKMDKKVIEAALSKADGDDSIVSEFKNKYSHYSADDLKKLIDNSNKQYLEKADFDINEVPKNLYNKVKGAALEKLEKEIASKYEITEYKGMSELVEKIVTKNKDGKVSEEAQRQIDLLKKSVTDKEKELADFKTEVDNRELNDAYTAAVNSIALDYDDEKKDGQPSAADRQRALLMKAFDSEYKREKKNGVIVVLDKKGEVFRDKLGDPMPMSDVLKKFAADYDFKLKTEPTGGRGGQSSAGGATSLKGLQRDKLSEYAEKKGIKENTPEFDQIVIDWRAANQ